jgi:hypothetical protein
MWDQCDDNVCAGGFRAGGLERDQATLGRRSRPRSSQCTAEPRLPRVHEINFSSFSTSQTLSPSTEKRGAMRAGYAVRRLVMGISVTHQLHEIARSSEGCLVAGPGSIFHFIFIFVFSSGVRIPFSVVFKPTAQLPCVHPPHFAAAPTTSVLLHGTASHAFTAPHPQRASPAI